MSEEYIYLNTVFYILVGWYWAKTEWSQRITEEKAKQTELALQIMFADNSVSKADVETYFGILRQVEALVSASSEWFRQQIVEDIRD
jgi:hypothetical protein